MTNTPNNQLTAEEFTDLMNRTSEGTSKAITQNSKRVQVTLKPTKTNMAYTVSHKESFGWFIESVSVYTYGKIEVIYITE